MKSDYSLKATLQWAFIIFVVSQLCFLPLLGSVHLFDWDEINFAEAAREMLVTKDYLRVQIDFEPFWEKPPLFIWFQAAAMALFGVTEFAARLPNAICGGIALSTLFVFGSFYKKSLKFGFIWMALYAASLLPYFYFKTGLIDPWYNYFTFAALWILICFRRHFLAVLAAGALCGCAVLTKGPAALLCLGLSLTVLYLKLFFHSDRSVFGEVFSFKNIAGFGLATIFVSSTWYLVDLVLHGPWFVTTFVKYQLRLLNTQDAGHGGPFYFHAVAILVGCFPSSFFALKYLFSCRGWGFKEFFSLQDSAYRGLSSQKNHHEVTKVLLRSAMAILFFVVLIIFSLVKTKIVHYASLTYYPLTFFGALWFWELIEKKARLGLSWSVALLIFASLIGVSLVAVPLAGMNYRLLLPYVHDPVARGALGVVVGWSYLDVLVGLLFLYLAGLSVWAFAKEQSFKALILLLCANVITLNFAFIALFPKAEKIAQGAVVDFYQGLKGCDCFVDVSGFKSYAQLFYSDKQPGYAAAAFGKERGAFVDLLKAPQVNKGHLQEAKVFQKPIYLVAKIHKAQDLVANQAFQLIKSEGGFLFFKRLPALVKE